MNGLLLYPSTTLYNLTKSPFADLEDLARFGGVGRVRVRDAVSVQADGALLDQAAGFGAAFGEVGGDEGVHDGLGLEQGVV